MTTSGEMKISNIQEREDGMVDMEVEFDEETRDFLISYAVNDILMKQFEQEGHTLEPYVYDNGYVGEQPYGA